MKSTKALLIGITVYLLNWAFISAIVWPFNDLSFKDTMSSNEILFIQLILGWIPTAIVVNDYNKLK